MKQPIEPEDIRKGDLIRYENGDLIRFRAGEYRAETDGDTWGPHPGRYFLLDRPKSPVDLPTEPTLGWASFEHHHDHLAETELGVWRHVVHGNGNDTITAAIQHQIAQADTVTAFTPAVAVPKGALDELREVFDTAPDTHTAPRRTLHYSHAIAHFLKAVDEANGDDR